MQATPISTAKELDGLLPDSQLLVANPVPEARAWGGAIRTFVMAPGSPA